jgi:hypothetical protein
MEELCCLDAENERLEGLDRRDDDLVTPPDREDEAVPLGASGGV